jgi:hypothetical protein
VANAGGSSQQRKGRGPGKPFKKGETGNPVGLTRERRAQIAECRAIALDILAEDPSVELQPPPTRLHAILRGLALLAPDDQGAARELLNRAYGQAPQHFTADASVRFGCIERVIVKPTA